jgi:hypothetical protein
MLVWKNKKGLVASDSKRAQKVVRMFEAREGKSQVGKSRGDGPQGSFGKLQAKEAQQCRHRMKSSAICLFRW